MRDLRLFGAVLLALAFFPGLSSAQRATDEALGVIARAKGDEMIRRAGIDAWQRARTGMPLYAGDRLRTGGFGALALVFDDETQIRLHRNSEFVVRSVSDGGQTATGFALLRGAIWSRAKSAFRQAASAIGRRRFTLETPVATLGIRGTDWYTSVAPETGAVSLIVLDGAIQVSNAFGAVEVNQGQQARVEPGQAPVMRVLIDIRDRPLMALELRPRWFDVLSVTGLNTRGARTALAQAVNAPAADPLRLAELAYDGREFLRAERALDALPESAATARASLLRGLLAARRGEFDGALALLDHAAGRGSVSQAMIAELAIVGVLMADARFEAAEQAFETLSYADPGLPEVAVYRSALAFARGDNAAAIAAASTGAERYPGVSALEVLRAFGYLLIGESQRMREALDAALQRNPDDAQAWHLQGIYYSHVEPNAALAVAAYEQAVAIDPGLFEAWNNLALVHMDLGDYPASRQALAIARERSDGAALVLANLGMQARALDRLGDADAYFEQALTADPAQPHALLGRGYQALARGQPGQAVDAFLQAIVIDPSLPGAHTALGIAYYQAGERAAAQAIIERAMALDPNDPVAAQIGFALAVDNSDIARAIPLAREALRKALQYDSYAVDGLASARTGITNVGSAYSSLGLVDWANYYAQLAFTPYSADSHILLSSVYAPRGITPSNGSLNLALALEPTAVSLANRFFEFVRTPGDDVTLGGGYGDAQGATSHSLSAVLQGFARIPAPLAYRLDLSRSDTDGRLRNSDSESELFNLSVGTRLDDRTHHLLFNLFASRSRSGLPGTANAPDPDDRDETRAVSATASYHLRLGFQNRVLVRLGYAGTRLAFKNGAPLGANIGDLPYSLLLNFDEAFTRDVLAQGLTDLNDALGEDCTPQDPCVGFGPGPADFGPPITAVLPEVLDDDSILDDVSDTRSHQLQFRHMLRLAGVDFTYGAEYLPRRTVSTLQHYDFAELGLGSLFDGFEFAEPFLFIRPELSSSRTQTRPRVAFGYAQARWQQTDAVWFETGAFWRHYDDEVAEPRKQFDPRLGAGWRLTQDHWIRAAFQRDLILPIPAVGPLAPVATMGFVVPQTQVLNGSSIDNLQAQWDGQWGEHVFTAVRYERQDIDGWFPLFLPVATGADLAVSQGRIQSLDVTANLWLRQHFGATLRATALETENREQGMHAGRDLPLLPKRRLFVGVGMVHPRRITANLGLAYTGQRYGDLANSETLPAYSTVDLSLGWQSSDRRISLGLGISNLLDEDYAVAVDTPAAGRSSVANCEIRF